MYLDYFARSCALGFKKKRHDIKKLLKKTLFLKKQLRHSIFTHSQIYICSGSCCYFIHDFLFNKYVFFFFTPLKRIHYFHIISIAMKHSRGHYYYYYRRVKMFNFKPFPFRASKSASVSSSRSLSTIISQIVNLAN